VVGVCLLLGLAGPVWADSLTYAYVFGQGNYWVAPGGTVSVDVYLTETGLPNDPFVLMPTGVGLSGTGVRLNYSGTAPAKVLLATDITGNSDFDNGGFGIAAEVDPGVATAGFTQTIIDNPAVHGTLILSNAEDVYRVYLGSFLFTAGMVEGMFPVTAVRFNEGENLVANDGSALDDLVQNGTATITVGEAIVPEPATLVGASLAAAWGLAAAWRRGRRA